MQTPTPERPCIIVGCTNSYLDPIRKDDLRQERRGVRRMWTREESVQSLVEMASPGRGRFFFDLIRKHNYDPQVAIVHLAGYGVGHELHIESGIGMEMVAADGFAQMIDKLPNVKLVYLNGCASTELLDHLFRKDIPAIFATRAVQDRSALHIVARRFYQHLSSGVPLGAAFDLMRQSVQIPFVDEVVSYDLENDRFTWESRDNESFAQGLFIQQDHQQVRNWFMPASEAPVEGIPVSDTETTAPKPRRLLSRILGLGVIAGLLMGGLSFFLWGNPAEKPSQSVTVEVPFAGEG